MKPTHSRHKILKLDMKILAGLVFLAMVFFILLVCTTSCEKEQCWICDREAITLDPITKLLVWEYKSQVEYCDGRPEDTSGIRYKCVPL